MRNSALIISTLFLMVTMASQIPSGFKPRFPITLPRSINSTITTVMQWMVQSAIHQIGWPLQFSLDPQCRNCTLLAQPSITVWPPQCNACVASFWEKMRKALADCEKCRTRNENCANCQNNLTALYNQTLGIVNALAKPYFAAIQYI